MVFLIVTGLSGAGKSKTVDALEDIGFFCIDNVPPSMIDKFYDLCLDEEMEKVAVVTDIRGGDMFKDITKTIKILRNENVDFKILFIDCSNDVLVNRFNETRRRHPLLAKHNTLEEAIQKERELLEPLRALADYTIDTTFESSSKLKTRISDLFIGSELNGIKITCMSFGFKYGYPREANIVFDVRCFPNPFYVRELRNKNGRDRDVFDYVMEKPEAREFAEKMLDMIDFLIPQYINEGKSSLVVAFGCTGGKHRSVSFAEYLCDHLIENKFNVTTYHRDILRFSEN